MSGPITGSDWKGPITGSDWKAPMDLVELYFGLFDDATKDVLRQELSAAAHLVRGGLDRGECAWDTATYLA